MTSGIAQAKEVLQKLLARYNQQFKDNTTLLGNEKQACQSLIVPLIRDLLHWNTEDPSEFKTEVSQGGKRVDYIVSNQGVSQFIVEAKAPSKDIFDNPEAYQQAINYGYLKDHDFAILTNFRQIVILAPKKQARVPGEAEIGRIDLMSANDEKLEILLCFEKKFWVNTKANPLYSLLGSYKPKIPVNDKLLEDLRHWRELLLTNIQKNKQNRFDSDNEQEFMHVEEEVQRLIDRLVFICFCEDKELHEPKLKELIQDKKSRFAMKPGYLLEKIRELFSEFKRVYNSDLFDKGDCDNFHIDDDKILDILEGLRMPKGRVAYDFKTIESDILGKVYENFIGHVTTGKKRFGEKEDIGKRKKSGIYYTPRYIVDYIVNNTVRKYIDGKSFEEINRVRILDPACGSGSFLLKAFDVLVEESEKNLKRELTYEEKKNLMLNCIFGVDIDERACEVAKLNLSLKLAERGKLPSLRDNIRLGNSLIDDKAIAPWKAFAWKEEFPEIMTSGGFDVVIGNPPYGVDLPKDIQEYLDSKYNVGSTDTAILFIKKAYTSLKSKGLFGFIIPKAFYFASNWKSIRNLVWDDIINIVDCGKAWKDVKLEQVIFIIKEDSKSKSYTSSKFTGATLTDLSTINKQDSKEFGFLLNGITKQELIIGQKIKNNSIALNEISENQRGAILQEYIAEKGDREVIGGAQVQRFGIIGIKGRIDKQKIDSDLAYIKDNSLLVQNIIAHIQNPQEHIQITCAIPENKNLILVDTINQITLQKNISRSLIWAMLNSRITNWYAYRFIFGKAIRTMHFDNAVTARIPLPKRLIENQQSIAPLTDKLFALGKRYIQIKDKQTDEKTRLEKEIQKIDDEICQEVYKLYGLTEEERKIIEKSLQ